MALLGIGAVRLKMFLGLLTVFYFIIFFFLLKISSLIHLFLGTILHLHLH